MTRGMMREGKRCRRHELSILFMKTKSVSPLSETGKETDEPVDRERLDSLVLR